MTGHFDFPILETGRLILRQLTNDDLDFVFRHFSDPRVNEYLLDEPPVASLAEAQAIIDFYQEPKANTYNRWGLVRKSDGRMIGTVGFHKWSKAHRRAEIGYDLSPGAWGEGYMSEAVRAAIGHGFEHMALHRIDALVYTANDRSFRLLQKLGFRQEGLLRDYFTLNGVYYDHYLYALLATETGR